MYQLYGISNCDTVKKARKHLEGQGVDFEFIDFKKSPPTKKLLASWKKDLGALPVNKKSRTYREVKEQYDTASEKEKVDLLIEKSSLIKRPLLVSAQLTPFLGYDKEYYDGLS